MQWKRHSDRRNQNSKFKQKWSTGKRKMEMQFNHWNDVVSGSQQSSTSFFCHPSMCTFHSHIQDNTRTRILHTCCCFSVTKPSDCSSDALQVECHCDTDLDSLWPAESSDDPVSVKSQSGCVIVVSGCPIDWVHKL